MKKWVVYLILHSFLVLCACQPTPEQPAITENRIRAAFGAGRHAGKRQAF